MLVPLVEKETPSTGPARPLAAQLTPLETEIIDFFVQLSRVLGQPRSLAEIYGLLFISARPLAMDDLIERLQLSKGSASQGLKFLCGIGAARTVYVPGERRTHYEAVAELRNLATRFLRDQVVPHLDNGQARLERIADILKQLPLAERARINGRVKMLQSWERQSRRFLPLLVRIMGH
jgi:HTH-type transcriptional regulator, glycine betaine synthesis regulator